jgi:hypothetical protein
MTLEVSSQPRWIIEGVFGWLAEVALPTALRGLLNEGLWHVSDPMFATRDVCSSEQSGHARCSRRLPKMTPSGHGQSAGCSREAQVGLCQ